MNTYKYSYDETFFEFYKSQVEFTLSKNNRLFLLPRLKDIFYHLLDGDDWVTRYEIFQLAAFSENVTVPEFVKDYMVNLLAQERLSFMFVKISTLRSEAIFYWQKKARFSKALTRFFISS